MEFKETQINEPLGAFWGKKKILNTGEENTQDYEEIATGASLKNTKIKFNKIIATDMIDIKMLCLYPIISWIVRRFNARFSPCVLSIS